MAHSLSLEQQCLGNLKIMEDGSVIDHFQRLSEAWKDTVPKLVRAEPTKQTLRIVGEFLHRHRSGAPRYALMSLLRESRNDTREKFKKILKQVEGPPATVTYVRSLADEI